MKRFLAAALKWARTEAGSWVRDAVGVGGFALIVYGVHSIYPPAGYITAGLVLIGLVLMSELGVR